MNGTRNYLRFISLPNDPRSTIHDPRSTIHDPLFTNPNLLRKTNGLGKFKGASDRSPDPFIGFDI
jgi:hypothetical protein